MGPPQFANRAEFGWPMPEEIGIALVVLFVLVWLTAKILQVFGHAIGKSYKEFSDSLSARGNARFLEKKSRFSQSVSILVPSQLDAAEQVLDLAERRLQAAKDQERREGRRPFWVQQEFKPFTLSPQDETYREMNVDDVGAILQPTSETWSEQEARLLSQSCQYPHSKPAIQSTKFSPIEAVNLQLDEAHFLYDRSKITEDKIAKYFERERRSVIAYNERRSGLIARQDGVNKGIQQWNDQSKRDWEAWVAQNKELANEELLAYKRASDLYVSQCEQQKRSFAATLDGYNNGIKDDVVNRVHCILSSVTLPRSVPRVWDIDFDEEERILVIEIGLPDVVHHPPSKTVTLKKGPVKKPLSQTERKEVIPRVHPAVLLRVAHEVFCNDQANIIRLLVLNGWVKFDDPSTGANTKAYTASLMIEKEQISGLNLSKIDPLAAFDSLHGKSAGKLIEIIPIEPTLSLNRKDSRFVDAKAVLNTLGKSTNLAAMDWQDFEHLIRELFEKEFAGRGAEVKITRSEPGPRCRCDRL